MKNYFLFLVVSFISCTTPLPAVVFQTDFGLKDGAVAEMKGVVLSVDPSLQIFDITHEIPQYNIWEAAYRLNQAAAFWPRGTVFVSVVDPGVGTARRSVVLRSGSGHYFVSPDNGTLTLIAKNLGIEEIREIDEKTNRRKGSERSNTFHGRDVYAYTAARLAAGKISFHQVGKELPKEVVSFNYQEAILNNGIIKGNIPVLDTQFGNVWTNIPDSLIYKAGWNYGQVLAVEILNTDSSVYKGGIPLVRTFGGVPEDSSLAYFNSLLNFSLAVNQGSFSKKHNIGSGPQWTIIISKFKNQE
ncbi:MAG TPA: S-adenosyl-l-methionine hydroxide adenosyltransferase family protein [Chitinophagaceae bacterium]|nr:S-adenosyl-l-methionine hydroxide adenosyltransferase family protein [Chitinophagaceae bacterium]